MNGRPIECTCEATDDHPVDLGLYASLFYAVQPLAFDSLYTMHSGPQLPCKLCF